MLYKCFASRVHFRTKTSAQLVAKNRGHKGKMWEQALSPKKLLPYSDALKYCKNLLNSLTSN